MNHAIANRRLTNVDQLLENWDARHLFTNFEPSIQKNLLYLGVDVYAKRRANGSSRGQGKNFWKNYADVLPFILKEAHQGWRNRMKQCHSKLLAEHIHYKNKQALKRKMLVLNSAWDRVENMFKNHGIKLHEQD